MRVEADGPVSISCINSRFYRAGCQFGPRLKHEIHLANQKGRLFKTPFRLGQTAPENVPVLFIIDSCDHSNIT